MKKCNYIKKIHTALKNADFERFDEAYLSIRDGKCKLNVEEIVSLCELLTYNFEYMAPHQSLKIVKMTFLTIDEYETKIAFRELVKGLKIIYNSSLNDDQEEGDEYIERYISSLLSGYKEDEISLFGNLIKDDDSTDFKNKIVAILEESMEYYAEADYVAKGTMLIELIKTNLKQ